MNFPTKSIKVNIKPLEKLACHTSFRIGGPAALWAEPRNLKELKKVLLFAAENDIDTFVIGGGTNVLARDEGFDGLIIKLSAPEFKGIKVKGAAVTVGAGYNLSALVRFCSSRGLGGLESLVGIPGTVGGAVQMNAGGWSSPLYGNMGDHVTLLKVMDHDGRVRALKGAGLEFGYRCSNLSGYVIIEATLKLKREKPSELLSRSSKFLKMKKAKQVLDAPSAGCVFKNPANSQFTTGQMIDSLGLKGKRAGGAEISDRHANFIVNKRGAKCKDVLRLIDLIKKKVVENYNIELELEIKII